MRSVAEERLRGRARLQWPFALVCGTASRMAGAPLYLGSSQTSSWASGIGRPLALCPLAPAPLVAFVPGGLPLVLAPSASVPSMTCAGP